MKKMKILLSLFCLAILFPSCESTLEQDLLFSKEQAVEGLVTKSLVSDSLETGNIIVLEETEELKALKKKLDEKERQCPKGTSNNNYDENFHSNILAINGMPITICARGLGNSSGKYLYSAGLGREVTLHPGKYSNNTSFYLRVLPASTGVPYLIYASNTRTPLSVGQYASNPNQKVLYVRDNDTGSISSADWDLVPSNTSKGYFAIESQSYLGQSNPNDWWSVFNYVVEVRDNNKLGYSKYTNRAQQEFEIKPTRSFALKNLTYNASSAVITSAADLQIKSTGTNPSIESNNFTINVSKSFTESSYFSEKKGSLNFDINNLTKQFQRPTVLAERIVLPVSSTPYDATYKTSSTFNINKSLNFKIEGGAPENCLIEVTSNIKTYNVSIGYTATAECDNRVIKFSGTWRGRIISDPNTTLATHHPRFFDLTTGEEVYYTSSFKTK